MSSRTANLAIQLPVPYLAVYDEEVYIEDLPAFACSGGLVSIVYPAAACHLLREMPLVFKCQLSLCFLGFSLILLRVFDFLAASWRGMMFRSKVGWGVIVLHFERELWFCVGGPPAFPNPDPA